MCRKILSNYNSTTFFVSVFRQEFSSRFFDSKFRQHLTNFYGNRQIFCRLLSNFVENYCRKILSKLDNIFRQDFSPANDGIWHFSPAFDKIFCRMLSNTVWKCCRKLLSNSSTALFDKFCKEAWSIFVEDCRIVAKLCFYRIRQRSLKRNIPRGEYFL